MKPLTRVEIAELQEICYWLNKQPCQCAYSKDIIVELPHLAHWFSYTWRHKRKQSGLFYYQVGYGWRLHRKLWQRRLEGLTQSVA